MSAFILPGTIIRVSYGFYKHYGIMTDCNTVIHNSSLFSGVTESEFEVFKDGRSIEISHYKPNCANQAIAKARQRLSDGYNLFTSNCEHFVRDVCGLEVSSTQVQKYSLVSAGALIAYNAKTPVGKIIGGSMLVASALTDSEKSPIPLAVILGGIGLVGLALLDD